MPPQRRTTVGLHLHRTLGKPKKPTPNTNSSQKQTFTTSASPGSQLTILAVPAPNMARRRSRASRSWGEVRVATRRAAPLIMEQAKSPNCRNHTGALPGPLVTSCHLPGNQYAANLPGPQGLPLRERHPSRLSGTGFASDPKKCNHLQRNP